MREEGCLFSQAVGHLCQDLDFWQCDNIIKSDFNGEDAYSIFENDRRGYVTDLDMKYGLNSLDIFPTQEEIALLIKRYDARGEGIIT